MNFNINGVFYEYFLEKFPSDWFGWTINEFRE